MVEAELIIIICTDQGNNLTSSLTSIECIKIPLHIWSCSVSTVRPSGTI